jgi:hypothetical protein
MLMSVDNHDIFSLDSTGLNHSWAGKRSSLQILAGYYNYQSKQQTKHLTNQSVRSKH